MATKQQAGVVANPHSSRSSLSTRESRASRQQTQWERSRELGQGSPQEQLEELRNKYSNLEGDRRSAVEVAQFTIRQNRETLAHLKREQKEIKSDLKKRNALVRDDGSKSVVEKEIEELEKRVHTLRRTHDRLCQHRQRCVGKLSHIQDGIKDLERGSRKSVSSPLQKGLRSLENRLDKAIIKRNEAVSIQRTYEQLLKRLKDECSAFDVQIKSMEEALAAKKSDVAHLTQISHDAQCAREIAKQDLQRLKEEVDRERGNRSKELEAQHHQLKAVQEMSRTLRERQQSKVDPAAVQQGTPHMYIADHKEAFRHIQLNAHVERPGDLCDKFIAQDHAFEDLQAREKTSRQQWENVMQEFEDAKIRLEHAKSTDPLTTGSAAQVDRVESSMRVAVDDCNKASAVLEESSKVVIEIKAGLQHLTEMLEDMPRKVPPVPLSDETLVEVTIQCGDCMERAKKALINKRTSSKHQDLTDPGGIHTQSQPQNETQNTPNTTNSLGNNGMVDSIGVVSSAKPDLT